MKVLVTGGGGFIGSELVFQLVTAGHGVRVLAAPGECVDRFQSLPVDVFRGDITRPETLPEAFVGVDTVVHLAALAGDWAPWDVFERVNVAGTRNVILAAEQAGAGRLVHMSSLAVHRYRDLFGADEGAARDATGWSYGRSKKLAEEEVEQAGKRGALETVVIRPALAPYGPRDPARWGRILAALERGGFAYVRGGRARIGVIHVADLARGLILACSSPRAAGNVFVLSDPAPVTWRDIMECACRRLGVPPPRLSVPYPVARSAAVAMETCWKTLKLTSEPLLTRYRVEVSSFDLFFSPSQGPGGARFSDPGFLRRRHGGHDPVVSEEITVGHVKIVLGFALGVNRARTATSQKVRVPAIM